MTAVDNALEERWHLLGNSPAHLAVAFNSRVHKEPTILYGVDFVNVLGFAEVSDVVDDSIHSRAVPSFTIVEISLSGNPLFGCDARRVEFSCYQLS